VNSENYMRTNNSAMIYENMTNELMKFHSFDIFNFKIYSDFVQSSLTRTLKLQKFPSKIFNLNLTNERNWKLERSSVLLFDSVNSLKKINKRTKLTNFFPTKFIFYVH
jgi:hypothetical protein